MSASGHAGAFKLLYPLAFLGSHLAFMPLLLLLLPRRVETLTPDSATYVLSMLLIIGAVTASVAHVAAGHWSDRWMARRGNRRLPVGLGLGLLTGSYGALALASSITALALALVLFQLSLNLMFAPLGALLSDYVEDRSKARTAAWLALALPLSIFITGGIATLWPRDDPAAFVGVVTAVVICVLPLVLLWPAQSRGTDATMQAGAVPPPRLPLADFRRAWLARFLVQCGAALIILYLYVYLRQLPSSAAVPAPASHAMSFLVTAGGLAGGVAVLAFGQVSDRLQRRRWPIAISGAIAATGLLLLAAEPGWTVIILAYVMFSAGLMAFLSIDSAMIAQLLGAHPARGKWLGIMNLTNTLPAIVTPTLTLLALQLASADAIRLLLATAALATCVAAGLILRVASVP